MEKLNNKIQRTQDQKLKSIQPTGVYGYNESDGTFNRAGVSDNGDLHVNIHGTTGGGDMKARTNINDSSTSTFLKCNADGTLEMTAELSTAGLATSAEQVTGNNTLSSIDNKIILPSVLNSDQLKVNDSAVVGSLAVINNNNTDGSAKVQILGNTESDGSGVSEHLHTDGNGNLNVQLISTALVAPANNTNSHITDDPANSVAAGLKGRTTIGTATTETFLLCDSDGHLQVDIVSGGGGGGDATAANQVTINNSIGDTNSKIDAMRGTSDLGVVNTSLGTINGTIGDTNSKVDAMRASDSLTTVKDGIVQNLTDGSTKAKIMGLFSGGQYQVATDVDGHLQVDVLSGGGGGTQFAGGAALVATGTGTAMIGRDSGNVARLVAVDTDGQLQIDIVGNSDTTKATSTLQTAGNSSLTSIDGKITACNTGAVVVSSTALPTGAATSALQTDGNNKLDSLRLNSQLNDVKSINTSTLGIIGDGTNLYMDTDGYSKLQINVVTNTGTGSPTMSIEWSDSSSFGAGDVFISNGTVAGTINTSSISFLPSTRVDSSTLTTQASAFYDVLPARYARITIFQSSGGAISYEAKSYLSH